MKKTMFKKSISLMLTVLMVLSCWVFFPGMVPEAEAAATLSTYRTADKYGTPYWNGSDVYYSKWKSGSTYTKFTWPKHIYLDVSESLQSAGYYYTVNWLYGTGTDYRTIGNGFIFGGWGIGSGYPDNYYTMTNMFNNYNLDASLPTPDNDGGTTQVYDSGNTSGDLYIGVSGLDWSGAKAIIWRNPDQQYAERTSYVFLTGTPKATGTGRYSTSGSKPSNFGGWQQWGGKKWENKGTFDYGDSNSNWETDCIESNKYKEVAFDITIYDKSALGTAVTNANARLAETTKWTQASRTNLQNVLNNNKSVLTTRATTQSAIDTAKNNINNAINALVLEKYDITFDNLINFRDWNKTTANNGTISNVTDNGFTLTCTTGEGTSSSPYFAVEPGKSYKVDIDIEGPAWDVYIFFCDANGKWIDFVDGESNRYSNNTTWDSVFTAPNKDNVVKAQIRLDANGDGTTVKFSNIRVYEVDLVPDGTSYVPLKTFDYGTALGNTLPVPTRPGYKFNGWWVDTVTPNGKKDASEIVTDGNGNVIDSLKTFGITQDWYLISDWTPIDVNYDNLFSLADWANSEGAIAANGTNIADVSVDLNNDSISVTTGPTSAYVEGYTSQTNGAGYYRFEVEPSTKYILEYDYDCADANSVIWLWYNTSANVASNGNQSNCSAGKGHKRVEFTTAADTSYITLRFNIFAYNTTAKFSNIAIYKANKESEITSVTNRKIRITSPLKGSELYTPTRTGYTFNGWFYDEACTNKVGDNDVFSKSTTVYSKWTPKNYTIKFVDASGTTVSTQQIAYGTKPEIPSNTVNYNYSDGHHQFAWPPVNVVTGDATYKEIETIEEHTSDKAATCTTSEICNICGLTITSELGHKSGEATKENVVPATCTTAGSYDNVYYCTRTGCGTVISRKTVTVPATGHTPGENATCTTAQTCKVCGEELNGKLEHTKVTREENRKDATCGADGSYDLVTYCSVCTTVIKTEKKTLNATGNHTYGNWISYDATTHRRTCSVCSEYEEASHAFETDVQSKTSTYHDYKCTTCDARGAKLNGVDTVGVAEECSWVETDSKDPTCTENGYKNFTCSACTNTKTETFNATNHNWDETTYSWSDDYAKCTATRVCKNDEKHNQTTTVDVVSEVTKVPTCEDKGERTYTATFTEIWAKPQTQVVEVDAKGHDMVAGETVAPTCSTDGYTVYTCANNCGKTENGDTVPATSEHHYIYTQNADGKTHTGTCGCGAKIDGTCAGGTATCENPAVCATCGAVYENQLGHKYEVVKSEDVTCTTDGYITYECSTCGAGYSETIKAVGHKFGDTVTANAATCTATGNEAYKSCTVCNKFFAETAGIESTDAKESANDFTIKINPDAHTTDETYVDGYIAPTCTETGHTGDTHWSCCDALATAGSEIPMIPHKDENTDHKCDYGCDVYQGIHADSETDDDHVCDYGCGKVLEDCSDATGDSDHNCDICGANNITEHIKGAETKENITNETCGEDGKYDSVYYCTECKVEMERTKDVVIPATGKHTLGEYIIDKDATCAEDGSKHKECSVCGYKTATESIPATGAHVYATEVEGTRKPATCKVEGSVTMQCGCGATEDQTLSIDGNNHINLVTDVAVESTCYSTGLTEGKHCGDCGKVTAAQTVTEKKDHTPGTAVQEDVNDSTCYAEGSYNEVVYCSVEMCNAKLSSTERTIAKKDHTPGETVIENEVPGNCGVAGSYDNVVYCSVCEAAGRKTELSRDKVTVPATGNHIYSDFAHDEGKLTHSKKCSVCSDVVTENCTESDWIIDVVATCMEIGSQYKKCTVCNYEMAREEIGTIAHNFGGIAVNKESGKHYYQCQNTLRTDAQCSEYGNEEECSGGTATCTDKAICDKCETAYGSALDHSFTNYVSNNDATCLENGTETAKCDRCDVTDKRVDDKSALGHNFTTETVSDEYLKSVATCKDAAVYYKSCSRCKISSKDQTGEATFTNGDPNGHNYDTTKGTYSEDGKHILTCTACAEGTDGHTTAVACSYDSVVTDPTCTKEGYTTHTCTVCSYSYTDNETEANKHSFGSWTSNNNGTHTRVCTVCTDEEGRIETVACSYDNVVTDPTCTKTGYTTHTCTVCKYSYTDNETEANKHSFGSWSSNDNGTHTRVCTVCADEPDREETADCTYGDWSQTIAPTCTTVGEKEQSCADCKYTVKDVVKALGHTFSNITEYKAPTCTTLGNSAYKNCTTCSKYFAADADVDSTDSKDSADTFDIDNLEHEYTGDYQWNNTATPKTHLQKCVNGCNEYGNETECTFDAVVTAPDCYNGGYTTYTCTACGNSYVADETLVREHIYVYAAGNGAEHKVTCQYDNCSYEATETCSGGAATCTDKAVCAKCKTAYGVALGHTFGATTEYKDPTCTTVGNEAYKSCETCKKYFVANADKDSTEGKDSADAFTLSIVEDAHSWNEGEVTTDSTCTAEGVKTYTCQYNNDHTYTESIELKEHSYGEWIAEVLATCMATGVKGHYECSVCKQNFDAEKALLDNLTIDINPDNHDWKVVSITPPISCGQISEIEYVCNYNEEHKKTQEVKGSHVDKNKDDYCDECGTYITDCDHDMIIDKVVEPTCEASGYTIYICSKNCGYTKNDSFVSAKDHTYVTLAAKAPTCTETGLTEGKYCSACKEVFATQEVVKALGHTEVTDEAVPATCLVAGKTEGKHCSVCKEVLVKQEVVPASGHTEETIEAKAPTCTETGLTEGKRCKSCGTVTLAQTIIGALGHDLDANADGKIDSKDGIITTPATCEGEGVRTYTCQRNCGHTSTESVDALGHDYKLTDSKDATCTAPGYMTYTCQNNTAHGYTTPIEQLAHIEGNAVKENEKAATCTETGSYESVVYCTKCSTELSRATVTVSASGHKEETVAAKAPTCTETGLTEGKRCSECKEVLVEQKVVDALNHNFELKDSKAATCKDTGYEKYVCTNDNSHIREEILEKLEHTYGDASCNAPATCTLCGDSTGGVLGHDFKLISTIAPTCAAQGYEIHKCTRCDVTENRNYISASHNFVQIDGKAPTCTVPGYEAYSQCSACGQAGEKVTIPATGHNYNEKVTPATCLEDGEKISTCSACGDTYSEVIKAKGSHTFGERKYTAATCTTKGNSYIVCADCGTKYDERIHEELGHNYSVADEYAIRVEATCENDGAIYRGCTRCGEREDAVYRTLPARGHYYFIYSDSVAATCETPGMTQAKGCLNCGMKVEPEIIPALGHKANKDGQCERCDSLMNEDGSACTCMCHKTSVFGKLIYKIVCFFWKLFKIKPACECGATHY